KASCLRSRGAGFVNRLVKRVLLDVRQHQLHTFARGDARELAPEAAAGTRDDRDLPGELFHRHLPRCSTTMLASVPHWYAGKLLMNAQVRAFIDMLKASIPADAPKIWQLTPEEARNDSERFWALFNQGGPKAAEVRELRVSGRR